MNLNNLKDAEEFQRHFVTPLIDAVRQEVKPIVDAAANNTARLDKLEKNQKKALTGWTAMVAVFSAGSAIVVAHVKAWFTQKVSGK